MKRIIFAGSALLVIAVLLVYAQSHAAVEALDYTIHQEYLSTRALGMGNAFAAVVDDHSSLFYNPAALAFRKDGVFRGFVRGGISPNYFSMMNDIKEINGAAASDEDKINSMKELLESNYGKNYFLRPTVGGVWARPRWAIAFIPVDLSLDLTPHRGVGPTLSATGYQDSTLAYGYGREVKWFRNAKFAWGATAKVINRIFISQQFLSTDLIDNTKIFKKEDSKEGLTLDVDIGTLYIPDVPKQGFFSFLEYMKPTFAFTVRNALDYGFPVNLHIVDKKTTAPPRLQRRFDIGSKFDLPKWWVFEPKIAADLRDIGYSTWNLMKGTHVGAELYWTMFNWWKGHWSAGLNQGYYTLGFGARFGFFQLDLASWGEEVGTQDTSTQSRRYMVEASLEF